LQNGLDYFAIVKESEIDNIHEVKIKRDEIPKQLVYFKDKYNLKTILLLKTLKHQKVVDDIEIRVGHKFLSDLDA
jgi:hypothetical protein